MISSEPIRCIVAGGRDYQFTGDDERKLDALPICELVSGGASGADLCGEVWAKKNNIPIKKFKADWKTYGRAAGPIRNKQMAEYADAVALFAGGKGTASMKKEARLAGILIYDFSIKPKNEDKETKSRNHRA